ncbi:MAG: fimbrillin family protein [Mediterranea sp.]|jgi:hypothetical protein|nr:fimbrillin family protein [Mediterranea sp.]
MKTRINIYIKAAVPLLALALWTGCTDNEKELGTEKAKPVSEVSAELYATDGAQQTRVSGTTWSNGDAIGLFMDGGEGYANMKWTTGGDGNFAPADDTQRMYYPYNNLQVGFKAYYPYQQKAQKLTDALAWEVQTNQLQEGLTKSDLMWAQATGASSAKPEVQLPFTHRLSLLTVEVTKDDDVPVEDLTNLQVKLVGAAIDGSLNLKTGAFTLGSKHSDIDFNTVTPQQRFNAVIPPQGVATTGTVKFVFTNTLNQNTYTYIVPGGSKGGHRWDAGVNYTYKLKLTKGKVELVDNTFEAWKKTELGSSNFVRVDAYNITGQSPSQYGTVKGMGNYPKGSKVTLTANPSAGMSVLKWLPTDNTAADALSTEDEYTFTANDNTSVYIMFKPGGRSEDKIYITSAKELQQIGQDPAFPLNGDYELAADIDMGGRGFKIGGANLFTGSFDGKDHRIYNYNFDNQASSHDFTGLFNHISGTDEARGLVQNFTLEGNVTGKDNVGAIASYISGVASIYNVTFKGTVTGTGSRVGGIVAYIALNATTDVKIDRCVVDGTVTGNGPYVGGIVSSIDKNAPKVVIQGCKVSGTITGKDSYLAGIVGDIPAAKDITLSTNSFKGNVTQTALPDKVTTAYVAGIVGRNNGGKLNNNDVLKNGNVNSKITSLGSESGGMAGYSSGRIAAGSVEADITVNPIAEKLNAIGGIVGKATAESISGVTYTGSINSGAMTQTGGLVGLFQGTTLSGTVASGSSITSAGENTGGLAGWFQGTTLNGNFTGTVNSSSNNVGGGVGYLSTGTVNNVKVTTGNITGSSYVGGVVGSSGNNTTVSDSSIDTESTVTSTYKAQDETDAEKLKQGAGGIIGVSRATLTNNTSAAKVNAVQYAGGVVGVNYTAITTRNVASGEIMSSGNEAGGIAGLMKANISNCEYTGGRVSAYAYVGGIVAVLNNASLENCKVSGTTRIVSWLSGQQNVYIGGIAGQMNGGKILNCNITGDNVTVAPNNGGYGNFVGGVTSQMLGTSSIKGGSFKTTVLGRNWVGGIASTVSAGSSISDVTVEGEVNAGHATGGGNIGGIAGINEGTITGARNTANVSGKGDNVGGIVGNNQRWGKSAAEVGTVTNSSSSGSVTGQSNNVGGIAGYSNGIIIACKASGTKIVGKNNVGGLVGKLEKYQDGGSNTWQPNIMESKLVDSYYLNLQGHIEATNGYVGGIVGELGNNYLVPTPGFGKIQEATTLKGCFAWMKELVFPGQYPDDIAGTIAGHVLLSIKAVESYAQGFYKVFNRDLRRLSIYGYGNTDGKAKNDFIPGDGLFSLMWPSSSSAYDANSWKNYGNSTLYKEDNPPLDCFPKLKWE